MRAIRIQAQENVRLLNGLSRDTRKKLLIKVSVTEHGEPDGLKKDIDFTERLRITCAIGELLAISPELLETPGRAGVTKAINLCLDHFTDGNRAAFARRFGITEMITATWSRGEFLPRIGTLLKICFLAGDAPINFLYGKVTFIDDETAGVGNHSGVGDPQPSRSRRYADEERALTIALKLRPCRRSVADLGLKRALFTISTQLLVTRSLWAQAESW